MLTNQQIKYFKSLQQKKFRNEHQVFVAEGKKLVWDLLESDLVCQHFFTTDKSDSHTEILYIDKQTMSRISGLKSPSTHFAVFEIPKTNLDKIDDRVLILDGVQDPGNLGTIIRLCDWFGIQQLICSPNSADCFNPKVIQASMGSIRNVKIDYTDLVSFIKNRLNTHVVLGTYMEGEDFNTIDAPKKSAIILGNEGKGISPELKELIDQKIMIPSASSSRAESLNVAMTCGILLSSMK